MMDYLTELKRIISQDALVESARIDEQNRLMITPVICDRRTTHRIQGVMFRAIRHHGSEDDIIVSDIVRPPVVKKRVYIEKRRRNALRFSHYEHSEWAISIENKKESLRTKYFDPFSSKQQSAA